jgi:protein gp37
MNRTKIEYLDYTWNPTVGCNGVGCAVREVCWARRMAKRQKQHCQRCYDFIPHRHPERLNEPLLRKKSARIGVSFLGDLYDKNMDIIWIQRIFDIMTNAFWHTFVSLTKQAYTLSRLTRNWIVVPKNVWLGVTVNRKENLNRIEDLKTVDSDSVKFVSFEPLYEDMGDIDLKGIDWVIIGAQTRPNLQPEVEWVHGLAEQARKVGAAVFIKNNVFPWSKLRLQEFPKEVKTS